jgi:hypothetical protein
MGFASLLCNDVPLEQICFPARKNGQQCSEEKERMKISLSKLLSQIQKKKKHI